MPPGPPLLCRSVCRESKKSPMARSWRSFFRRETDEEQENGPAVASEPERSTEDVEEGNGHLGADLEAFEEETVEEVPTPEEVQAERKEPTPEDVWEVDESEPEESLPEPGAVDEAPETIAERQESGGWFGRLRQGLSRSRASFVGQLNAAVAEFRDVEDEEFWERVEEILISSDVGVPTTAKLVAELEQEALERNIKGGDELRKLIIEHAARMLEGPVELDVSHTPTVILMVGVNGTGKTTTIGKLSRFLPGTKMFKEVAGLTGIFLTKLDGTAKGGIALAIANEVGVPIKLISVGEKVEDLHPFDAREFAEALFGDL